MDNLPLNIVDNPTRVKMPPTAINMIDLLVGAPLKNLDIEETNDEDESSPYTKTTSPAIMTAIPIYLFIEAPFGSTNSTLAYAMPRGMAGPLPDPAPCL